jgi:hypothetical protein
MPGREVTFTERLNSLDFAKGKKKLLWEKMCQVEVEQGIS